MTKRILLSTGQRNYIRSLTYFIIAVNKFVKNLSVGERRNYCNYFPTKIYHFTLYEVYVVNDI